MASLPALWHIDGKGCVEVAEVHRVAATRVSILFQKQSLPSQCSETMWSNKPSFWGFLLLRSTSFPSFSFPMTGAAPHSLSGKIHIYFFVSFHGSHLTLLLAMSGENNNNKANNQKEKLTKPTTQTVNNQENPRSWTSFPEIPHHTERVRESTQACAAA